ncbi:AMP-binding protein [Dactylosporangium vinaceum]|uniref:AMP-binding protein n=1 Tax=Dactylosporangium vinaceum TaxID=53362 RepID=A0ABV5MFV9_9ACTN|nr:AMP-binding protein [Dactylosporangium vinaceum]UAB98867.1 AMP-binding protein [Dactylosporangium vinaceum]
MGELNADRVLPGLLRRRATELADRDYLVDVAQGRHTYSDFQRRVEEFTGLLREQGVGPGDRVAVLLPTCVDEQALWIACGWLRAVQVPINPAYRGAMLRHVLDDCGPRLVVTVADRADELDAAHVFVLELGQPLAHDPAVLDGLDDPKPWDTAAVIYTSGTTGPSKGVLTPWGQLVTGIDAFDDIGPGDVLYAPFAAFHLGGKVPLQIVAHWGGTFVFRDGFKTDRFWPDVRAHGCTRAWAFYAMANFLWQQPPRPDDRDNPLRSITGGPLLPDHAAFAERFGVRMRTNYGMTEAGWPIATGDLVVDHRSCGRARPGYELRIVDDFDTEVPPGRIGELVIRADRPWTMNTGYLGRPADTARAWRNGWFHTGDAFRRDEDGNYFLVDRVKDAVRRRSENISSFEVESMVTAHPEVLECAAIGVPSEDGEEEIKICVVPMPDSKLEAPALAEFLTATMPRFMVPRYIELLDELPKTPTSKVRKVDLKRDPFTAATWDRVSAR